MRVYVNDKPLDLLPGMTVRHALVRAGLLHLADAGRKVYDAWGNELGLSGALAEGSRMWIK